MRESRTDLASALTHIGDLEKALEHSRTIGMATGILMERHKLGAEAAFERLRVASSLANDTLWIVAEALVRTGEDVPVVRARRN